MDIIYPGSLPAGLRDSSKLHRLLFWLLLTASLSNATAQEHGSSSDKGLVVYTLGSDTTTVQYFQYEERRFKTIILDLDGTVRKYEGVGLLDENGDIKEVHSISYQLDPGGNWSLSNEGDNILNGDSTIYTAVNQGKVVRRRAVAGKAIVSNAADLCSFYTFPYMGFFAPQHLQDTLFHCHFAFGQCRTYYVTRTSPKELHVGSSVMGGIRILSGKNGRMDSANAVGSSLNFVATVERGGNDYQSYIEQLAKVKFSTHSAAKPILKDTARLVVDKKNIEVGYWAPMVRGREIFGAVVPWNRVWRTGANNATKLHSEVTLQYDGQVLPIGEYSLWTYPTETDWYLLINKKANVWGTEYDSTADLMKLPLHVEKISGKVEALKIDLLRQTPSIIRIQIAWDHYKAWADFGFQGAL
jgi:hypothetical protein